MTDCREQSWLFQDLGSRKVEVDFGGGYLSSDGGGLILRELERRSGLLRDFSGCFVDYRDQRYIEHSVQELVSQAITAWHPDLRDLVRLSDPSTVSLLHIRSSVPIPHWKTNSITLLGDAIHSMTPYRGIGANVALCDATSLYATLVFCVKIWSPPDGVKSRCSARSTIMKLKWSNTGLLRFAGRCRRSSRRLQITESDSLFGRRCSGS